MAHVGVGWIRKVEVIVEMRLESIMTSGSTVGHHRDWPIEIYGFLKILLLLTKRGKPNSLIINYQNPPQRNTRNSKRSHFTAVEFRVWSHYWQLLWEKLIGDTIQWRDMLINRRIPDYQNQSHTISIATIFSSPSLLCARANTPRQMPMWTVVGLWKTTLCSQIRQKWKAWAQGMGWAEGVWGVTT